MTQCKLASVTLVLLINFMLAGPADGASPATQPATAPAAAPASQPVVDEQKQMEKLWDELANDEPFSTKALLDLSVKPDQTVAFLKDHLEPLKLDQSELEEMIKSLGSDDEKVWKPVVEKMEYLDPRLAMDISSMLELASAQPARNRLIEVLCGQAPDSLKDLTLTTRIYNNNQYMYFQRMSPNGGYYSYSAQTKVSFLDTPKGYNKKPQWARADRAIVLLQHIGTPGAVAILKDMATGNPEAQPTKLAKLAVESLGQ